MDTATNMHNCKEIKEKIIELLDNEISSLDKNALVAEMEKCEDCADFYSKLKKIKCLVSDKLGKKSCGDNIMGNIRSQINIQPN